MKARGATIWARKTTHSEIFYNKPDKWFKIWFFIVNRVNFTPTGKYGRGECFIPSGEIELETRASKDQVKKFLSWARKSHMISTKRSTRGFHIRVLNYATYQNLRHYSGTKEALKKHQRSTTIGEECNNDNNRGEQSSHSKLKDMGWKQYNENTHQDEMPAIDADSGEAIVDTTKADNSKVNKRKKELVDWLIKHQNRDPQRTNRPKQLKALNRLIEMKVTGKEAQDIIMEQEMTDYWKQTKAKPDFSTVVALIEKRGM